MKKNIIKEKSYNLAVKIVNLSRSVRKLHKEYSLADQLMRSGTSIGANVNEAIYAESRKDFVHKMKIAQKETSETIYWLSLLKDTQLINLKDSNDLISECDEIRRIISAIVLTMSKKDIRN